MVGMIGGGILTLLLPPIGILIILMGVGIGTGALLLSPFVWLTKPEALICLKCFKINK